MERRLCHLIDQYKLGYMTSSETVRELKREIIMARAAEVQLLADEVELFTKSRSRYVKYLYLPIGFISGRVAALKAGDAS